MLDKIVYAGTKGSSFAQGSEDLSKLAEVEVPAKQVERVCHRIGAERLAQREAAVEAYQALPLVERKAAPAGVTAPDVAVVGCDGGRREEVGVRIGFQVRSQDQHRLGTKNDGTNMATVSGLVPIRRVYPLIAAAIQFAAAQFAELANATPGQQHHADHIGRCRRD
jgi:hypothetical protein